MVCVVMAVVVMVMVMRGLDSHHGVGGEEGCGGVSGDG